VSAVYLCGGTARLAGLEERWTSDLGVPVRVLPLPQDAAPGIPEASRPAAAQSYALAARAPASAAARAPRFNLRRGEFAFKGHFDYLRDRLGLLASYAATLLVLAIAAGVVRGSVLARRERQVDAALCDITQRVLKRCERKPNGSMDLATYERALTMLRGQESPAAALPRYSAVDLLAELIARMPKGENGKPSPVTFDQMMVDLERISLRGQMESTKDMDTVTNALKTFRCFHDVKQGKLEKTRDGLKVLFRLEVQVECPTEQGGAGQG